MIHTKHNNCFDLLISFASFNRLPEAGLFINDETLATQAYFIEKRRMSGVDEQRTSFLTNGKLKLDFYEHVDCNDIVYEEIHIKAILIDFSQCRELLRLGKLLTFPNTDIANMIISLSDLIFKLAQMVVGQSDEVDQYIQQRNISTERVVDNYLLDTRGAAIPTSNDEQGNAVKKSRADSRADLDNNGTKGGKKADKKSITYLTKNVARTAYSIACRMNNVSKLSKVDIDAQVTILPIDPTEESNLLTRKRALLNELHDINQSLYSRKPVVINHNKVTTLTIINNPYEKSVLIHSNIPLQDCQDLISQFTDITQSHISLTATYTKAPHTSFDTDKYLATLPGNVLVEEMEVDVE